MSNLRNRLRADTRPAHDRVDAAFGRFNLERRAGYVGFLTAQYRSLCGLAAFSRDARDMLARLERDFDALRTICPSGLPFSRRVDPVALEYILLGSRLGLASMFRTFQSGRFAGATAEFLSTPVDPLRWRSFCTDLAALPATGARADAIVADACAVFAHYETAANSTADQGGSHGKATPALAI